MTIAQQTTQFPIWCSQSQRQMDDWQRTVVVQVPMHTSAKTQQLWSKRHLSNVTPPSSCSDWMPWCVTTFTSQQYINCSLFCETFHSHSLAAALLKSSENWGCDTQWVDPRITVPSSLWSSSRIRVTSKVNRENPCPIMQHHLADRLQSYLVVHWSAWNVSKENG